MIMVSERFPVVSKNLNDTIKQLLGWDPWDFLLNVGSRTPEKGHNLLKAQRKDVTKPIAWANVLSLGQPLSQYSILRPMHSGVKRSKGPGFRS